MSRGRGNAGLTGGAWHEGRLVAYGGCGGPREGGSAWGSYEGHFASEGLCEGEVFLDLTVGECNVLRMDDC